MPTSNQTIHGLLSKFREQFDTNLVKCIDDCHFCKNLDYNFNLIENFIEKAQQDYKEFKHVDSLISCTKLFDSIINYADESLKTIRTKKIDLDNSNKENDPKKKEAIFYILDNDITMLIEDLKKDQKQLNMEIDAVIDSLKRRNSLSPLNTTPIAASQTKRSSTPAAFLSLAIPSAHAFITPIASPSIMPTARQSLVNSPQDKDNYSSDNIFDSKEIILQASSTLPIFSPIIKNNLPKDNEEFSLPNVDATVNNDSPSEQQIVNEATSPAASPLAAANATSQSAQVTQVTDKSADDLAASQIRPANSASRMDAGSHNTHSVTSSKMDARVALIGLPGLLGLAAITIGLLAVLKIGVLASLMLNAGIGLMVAGTVLLAFAIVQNLKPSASSLGNIEPPKPNSGKTPPSAIMPQPSHIDSALIKKQESALPPLTPKEAEVDNATQAVSNSLRQSRS